MSSALQSGPVDRKTGLSKYVSRIWTRLSSSSRSPSAALSPASTPTPPSSSAPQPPAVRTPPPAPPAAAPATAPPAMSASPNVIVAVLRAEIDAERIRKLTSGLEGLQIDVPAFLAPNLSNMPKVAYRTQKPIRMRVHRTCHECQSEFRDSKTCPTCGHVWCTTCVRHPAKASGDKPRKEKTVQAPAAGAMEVDEFLGPTPMIVLSKPSKTGGQPLVRKRPMQRVRRTCHLCSALFIAGNRICDKCSHRRCDDCPRDPAKRKRYPDGYPNDVPAPNSTRPVKFACHLCSTVFPPVAPTPESPFEIDAEAAPCVRCGHSRCSSCQRAKAVKIEPSPHPDVLKSVEAKLAAFLQTQTPSTSEA